MHKTLIVSVKCWTFSSGTIQLIWCSLQHLPVRTPELIIQNKYKKIFKLYPSDVWIKKEARSRDNWTYCNSTEAASPPEMRLQMLSNISNFLTAHSDHGKTNLGINRNKLASDLHFAKYEKLSPQTNLCYRKHLYKL